MKQSNSICKLSAALVAAQSEMGGAVKDSKNPFFKTNYADLTSVIKAIKEPFAKNGLAYIQFPINGEREIGVTTRLIHESGEWLEQSYTVPLVKNDPQSAGSAITYARRYSLQAMAGIPAVDDDAESAMVRNDPPADQDTLDIIQDLIDKTQTDVKKFCLAYGIKSVDKLTYDQARLASAQLAKKLERMGGADESA